MTTQPHADKGRDLIVARTPCTQLATQLVTCDFKKATLKGRGLILIGFLRNESAGVDPALQLIERGFHPVELILGQQSGSRQGSGMRPRTGDVVIRETPVELRGLAQSRKLRRRARTESASP